MPFTDKERANWHREKSAREFRPTVVRVEPAIAVCICCHQPFGMNGGVTTEEVDLCGICNGE